ncbi:metallophosphoesterase [Rubritalea sp.]|uniref:metallophosphoesterase n=1 Tax=Rubritalea sp. TaxID=2109375 RepID=UPI003EFAE883
MSSNPISRRSALKQTFCFSAALLTGKLPSFAAPAIGSGPGSYHFTMIGDWGHAKDMTQQKAVAKGMTTYLAERKVSPDAMFCLGDNFYGKMNGGVKCSRWKNQFSEVYPKSVFPGPCHAILGNHEYDDQPKVKIEAQLGYSKFKPGTRWNMPAKWYRLDIGPAEKPLMTVLCLDSNYSNKRDQLTAEEKAEQLAWLKDELAKPRKAPWLVVNGHHPLYSNGKYGDFPEMIEEWDALFRKHKVHFYFCGHEHDLQHLQLEDHPTSFVISGGGGAPIRPIRTNTERGPFTEGVAGFTHLEVSHERFTVRHVDKTGAPLHEFWKKPDGTWKVMI